jgi:hypothetical protein
MRGEPRYRQSIDEVGPTGFVAYQPDVVPDFSSGETAIRHEGWR